MTLCLLSFVAAHMASAATPLPNIILVLADDQGWSDVGWHNNGQSLIADGPGQPHMKKLVA